MTDRYEKIRKALAMGPTPGPWELREGRTDTVENTQGYPVCTVRWHPDERYAHGVRAAYIAACDPDTIRKLLEERDALVAEVERLVDVLTVMDADRRAVALLSDEYYDAGKFNLAEKWSDHLSVHDEARAAVAKLIEESAARGEAPRAGDEGECLR